MCKNNRNVCCRGCSSFNRYSTNTVQQQMELEGGEQAGQGWEAKEKQNEQKRAEGQSEQEQERSVVEVLTMSVSCH